MLKSSIKARFAICLVFALGVIAFAPNSNADSQSAPKTLNVITTIPPLYALTAGVMQGVGEPQTLIKQGDSPHHFSMRPNDAKNVFKADIIICTSREYEYYLEPIIKMLPERKHTIIEALATPGMTLESAADYQHDNAALGKAYVDMHFWLNPFNAIAYTQYITEVLSEADPNNSAQYQANAASQIARLHALDKNIHSILGPQPRKAHYVSYHPALAYFEARYNISNSKTLTHTQETGVGAASAEALYKDIESGQTRCLFQEPEFSPRLMKQAATRYKDKVQLAVIDPLGNSYEQTPLLYDRILIDIAHQIAACSQP